MFFFTWCIWSELSFFWSEHFFFGLEHSWHVEILLSGFWTNLLLTLFHTFQVSRNLNAQSNLSHLLRIVEMNWIRIILKYYFCIYKMRITKFNMFKSLRLRFALLDEDFLLWFYLIWFSSDTCECCMSPCEISGI